MKDEKEIKDALNKLKEALTKNMSELDTAYHRGQYASLKWALSDEKPQDGFSED